MPVTKPGEGYAEFLLGWNEYKDDPNVLFVHFENLKKVLNSSSNIETKVVNNSDIIFSTPTGNIHVTFEVWQFLIDIFLTD